MNGNQWLFFILSLLIVLLASFSAQFNWIRSRRAKSVVYFIAGVLTIACLWITGLPPKWFDGSKTGFGLGLSFAIGAWIPGGESERAFRLPLFLGLGLALLVANVLPHL